jgi:PhnO protein
MTTPTFRKVTDTDASRIYQMVCKLEDKKLDERIFQEIFAQNIQDPKIRYIVAELDGDVVGFVSLHMQQLLHQTGRVAEIHELFVESTVRGKGIGKGLIEFAKQIADENNCKTFEVACNLKRKESHAFYEREGFTTTHFKFTQKLG